MWFKCSAMFLYADLSPPPALHNKIKGLLMEKMKGSFHKFLTTLCHLIYFQSCICLEHTLPHFYWLTICCCAPWEAVNLTWQPKERKDTVFCPLDGHFCLVLELTSPLLLVFFYWFFKIFLTGGKCHSYQWRTGGWNNNERVVWCQRSDGVNVTGE